jgi:hypothetical protein
MRSSEAAVITGPTSFSTSLRIGVSGWIASAMPIRPPIEVPTQSTLSAPILASSVAMSAQYCGMA